MGPFERSQRKARGSSGSAVSITCRTCMRIALIAHLPFIVEVTRVIGPSRSKSGAGPNGPRERTRPRATRLPWEKLALTSMTGQDRLDLQEGQTQELEESLWVKRLGRRRPAGLKKSKPRLPAQVESSGTAAIIVMPAHPFIFHLPEPHTK